MKQKKCYTCSEVKSLECFVKDPKTKDGTRNLCKKCFNKRRRDIRFEKNKKEKLTLKMYDSLEIRECKKCRKIKPFESFVKNKLCKYGIEHLCLSCRNERLLDWRSNNPEKKKDSDANWRFNNKDHIKQTQKKYRDETKEERKIYDSNRKMLKRDQIRETGRRWRVKNREHVNKKMLERKQNDIQFKLSCIVRSRLNTALKIKNVKKQSKCLDLLGCSFEELKKHIENQFKPGMSWDKLGRGGIHIDHIKPLAMFDLSDEKQLREACHYTNLQPLWEYENLSKGARWIG